MWYKTLSCDHKDAQYQNYMEYGGVKGYENKLPDFCLLVRAVQLLTILQTDPMTLFVSVTGANLKE